MRNNASQCSILGRPLTWRTQQVLPLINFRASAAIISPPPHVPQKLTMAEAEFAHPQRLALLKRLEALLPSPEVPLEAWSALWLADVVPNLEDMVKHAEEFPFGIDSFFRKFGNMSRSVPKCELLIKLQFKAFYSCYLLRDTNLSTKKG